MVDLRSGDNYPKSLCQWKFLVGGNVGLERMEKRVSGRPGWVDFCWTHIHLVGPFPLYEYDIKTDLEWVVNLRLYNQSQLEVTSLLI